MRSDESERHAVKTSDTLGITEALHNLALLLVKHTQGERITKRGRIRLMDDNGRLAGELAETKRENEFLKKASSHFAKNQK